MRSAITTLVLVLLSPLTQAAEFHVAARDTAGLRNALQTASADRSGEHRIVLAAGALYTLDDVLPGNLGLPPLSGKIRIVGNGAEIRRYTPRPMTLLQIEAEADVVISDLVLAEGSLGAVRNFGSLELQRVAVTDSSGEALRGILLNHGVLVARECEFSHNAVHGSGRDAGTLVNFGRMQLIDSRVVDNSLSRRYPSLAAATVLNIGELSVSSSRFEGNDVVDEFGGLTSSGVLNLLGGRVDADADLPIRNEVAVH